MNAKDYIDYDEDGNKIVRTVDGANREALNAFAVYLIRWGEEHMVGVDLTPDPFPNGKGSLVESGLIE